MALGEAKARQFSFAIGPDNRFQTNLLDNLFSRFGNAVEVSKLALNRRIWKEVPEGKVVIADLLDSGNRQIHTMDQHFNVFGSQPFERQTQVKGVSMAVVMIPELNVLSKPVIEADITLIVDKLSNKGGGLIIIEKVLSGKKPDKTDREQFLAGISSHLIKPKLLIGHDGLCLWETRKKLPNQTWKAIVTRNKERLNRQEGVGRHTFIADDGSGTTIVDIGPKIIAVSQVGETDGVGQKQAFVADKKDQSTETPDQRRFRHIQESKQRQKQLDRKKFFITNEMLNNPIGFLIKRNCPSGAHSGQSQPLTLSLRKIKDLQKGRISVQVDTACGHCDYNEPLRKERLKPYTKEIDGKKVTGWVKVTNN